MRAQDVDLEVMISLYPPATGCATPTPAVEHQQRIIGLCYHHADLRLREAETPIRPTFLTQADRSHLPGCPRQPSAPCDCLRQAVPWSTLAEPPVLKQRLRTARRRTHLVTARVDCPR